jgi:hypothetical protein
MTSRVRLGSGFTASFFSAGRELSRTCILSEVGDLLVAFTLEDGSDRAPSAGDLVNFAGGGAEFRATIQRSDGRRLHVLRPVDVLFEHDVYEEDS